MKALPIIAVDDVVIFEWKPRGEQTRDILARFWMKIKNKEDQKMRRINLKGFVGFMAILFLLGLSGHLLAGENQPLVVKSKNSFDETVSKIKKAFKDKGLAIVFEANHKNMMAMVGMESKESRVIGFAKPQMGAKVMGAEPRAALEMPMRLAVRELDNGEIIVIYYQPSYLFSHYKNPKLDKIGKKMDKMVGTIVKAGTE